ncbi:MAG: ATP synthase F1 subunit delta [Erysipelotrichaceae bacterium]|nr:ATP synthase F1 subunit delta [Erysipelotrichaceae bacterium]
MSSLVSSYTSALFNVLDKQELDDARNNLNSFVYEYKNNAASKLFNNPNILKGDKKKIIDEIFNNSKLGIFLKVLVDNNRFNLVEDISKEFNSIVNEELKIEECILQTAIKLDDESLNKIRMILEKKLNKKVVINEKIDKNLIAGIKVILKDEIIDNSIETKLNNIKNSILG